jgi:4a-hydroxytetrahydrobiopterin dehydratase
MERFLSRREASEAVGEQGWRFVLGTLRTFVPVESLAEAAAVAARAVEACGADADDHLRLDLRPKVVSLALRPHAFGGVTARDTELAHSITAALRAEGLETTPGTTPDERPTASRTGPDVRVAISGTDPDVRVAPSGTPDVRVAPSGADPDSRVAASGTDLRVAAPGTVPGLRAVQEWEIAIDVLDISAVRPFWKAVLGYTDEAGKHGPEDRLVDPLRQGPAVWFQRMSEPRDQRNRVHFDISVPHDEAPRRLAAALAAGGRLVSEARAPSFWVLADGEGNEVCITTWQGRDA